MDSKESFSKRNNFEVIQPKEITIRNEAPLSLRKLLCSIPNSRPNYFKDINSYRSLVNGILFEPDDLNNWSYNNVVIEINYQLMECEWYRIYDIIEKIYEVLDREFKDDFTEIINNHFQKEGIGWKLEGGKILKKGGDIDEYVQNELLNKIKKIPILKEAQNEFKNAIHCLSLRPDPNLSGALTHSCSGLELVYKHAYKASNKKADNMKLSDLFSNYPIEINNHFSEPINKILLSFWGYASNNARHRNTITNPEIAETEFIVTNLISVANYIIKKKFKIEESNYNFEDDDDVPF